MKNKNPKSVIYVLLQFSLLLLIIIFGNYKLNIVSIVFTAISIILGIWSAVVMNFNFSIFPEISNKTKALQKSGPYKYIRHPMYTSILLFCIPFIMHEISATTIVLYIFLLFTLYLKSEYEEKMLEDKFGNYKEYKSSTKKFIPFIF